jgi:hypothetical protein
VRAGRLLAVVLLALGAALLAAGPATATYDSKYGASLAAPAARSLALPAGATSTQTLTLVDVTATNTYSPQNWSVNTDTRTAVATFPHGTATYQYILPTVIPGTGATGKLTMAVNATQLWATGFSLSGEVDFTPQPAIEESTGQRGLSFTVEREFNIQPRQYAPGTQFVELVGRSYYNEGPTFTFRYRVDTAPAAPPAPPPAPPGVNSIPLGGTPVPVPISPNTTLQYDPKSETFFIRIQYRVREGALKRACRRGCRAQAEIRTRKGRRLYGSRLPGDGLVLGSKGGLTIRTTKRVRIDVPVRKSRLLEADFRTAGRFRVADTRLRVVLRTSVGNVLTVRDGNIRVSIARIESGALPGLQGVLAL